MKKTLLLALGLTASIASQAQFAAPNGIATNTAGLINLTPVGLCPPPGTLIAGSIWSTTLLNFNASFTLTFHAKFSTGGGDGIAVAFKSNASVTSLNAGGGCLGYYNNPVGIPNADFARSFAVELDIYNDGGTFSDIAADHFMVAKNAGLTGVNVLAAPVNILNGPTTVKDNSWHTYTIQWTCGTNTLDVTCDQVRQIHDVRNYRTIFTTPTAVTWGFTGGGSSSCNDELVTDVVLTTTQPCCTAPCPSNISLHVTPVDGDTTSETYPCTFNSTATVIDSTSCWTPSVYTWKIYNTMTNNTVVDGSTSFSDNAHLPFPIGSGDGHIKVIITFTDAAGSTCIDSAIYADSVWCNGGYAGQYKHGHNTTQVNSINSDGTDINIYPNPTSSSVNVAYKGGINRIEVTDITGKLVAMYNYSSLTNVELSLEKYPSGTYIVRVNDAKSLTVSKIK